MIVIMRPKVKIYHGEARRNTENIYFVISLRAGGSNLRAGGRFIRI
jgi:hypothetical protein